MAKSIVIKGKALVQSKTFWFNILAVVIAVASMFGFGEFEPTPQVTQGITTLVAIINIVLRIKSSQPITRVK